MINVISSEFYKIFRSRVFYIVSGILLLFNSIVLGHLIYDKCSATRLNVVTSGLNEYRGSYNEDFIVYVILIFTAYIITSEYTNKSIRQIACHGIERWKIVLGQYIAISAVMTLILICFGLINLAIYTPVYGIGSVAFDVLARMNIGLICIIWGVSGFAVFISYVFKNGIITTIISLVVVIGTRFVTSTLSIMTGNNEFMEYDLSGMRKVIFNFNSSPNDVMKYSVVFLFIGAVCVALSSLIFTKTDIH